MLEQGPFQTHPQNKEEFIKEYLHLLHRKKEMPAGKNVRLFQRLAELQGIIGEDMTKINEKIKNTEK